MPDVQIYGAGDTGSLELRGLLTGAGYEVEFRDIRGQVGTPHRDFLFTRGLQVIPQVFRSSGEHLGDYDTALTELGL